MLWSAGAAAALIAIVTILSHGRAVPASPVQSLTGQTVRAKRLAAMSPSPNMRLRSWPAASPPREQASTQAVAPAPNVPPVQQTTPTVPSRGVTPLQGKLQIGYGWVYDRQGGFWYYHTAWDIAATPGAPVRSAFAGTVQDIEPDGSAGLSVSIASPGAMVATYAGLSDLQVHVG